MIHQVACSPFTNHVEIKHFIRYYNAESTYRTVMETWSGDALTATIGKVFERLNNVLCLINDGNGSNDLVETKRGVQNRNMKMDWNNNSTTHDINLENSDDEEDECYFDSI